MTAATRRASARPPRRSAVGWIAWIVFATIAALGLLAAFAVLGAYMALSRDLDAPDDINDLPFFEESIVYDRTGEIELARFGDVQREVVTFEEVPAILVDATTAVEDGTFWENPGFDPAAIVASGIDAIRGNPRGASTITQQLVRQRLLPPELVQAEGRTVERKLKEIIQSIRLTQAFPGDGGKEAIITAYLNQNYYGNNSYGVKAAARSYFDKNLDELSLSEVAILAALPQSPSSYDLVRNAVENPDGELVVPEDTDIVQRRNHVLDLLSRGDRTPLSGREYTRADFQAAKDEPVVVAPQNSAIWTAPHFIWALRDELAARLCPEAQTCNELEQGGFRITSTLDVDLQEAAERWVRLATLVPKSGDPAIAAERLGFDELPGWVENLVGKDLHNGALVALDYQTGELISYVGSATYYTNGDSEKFQSKFDVVGKGWRQPGSAFKPLNYVTGIDDGTLTAATMFMDAATDFGGGYTPSNADNLERGPVRVRQALQFSLNIPAVKAMQVNSVERVFARAQDYGVRWREATTDAGLAFALGVEEIRPVDLVTAYGTLANNGRYTGHTTILRVTDRQGEDVVPPHERPEGEQALSPQAAAIMTDILKGNTNPRVNPFWGEFAIPGREATLKTGTNNDARDLNAYGYIPPPTEEGRAAGEYALAVGVWNGNSDNTVVSTPDRPVFSIDVSTHIWQGFLSQASEGWTTGPEFTRPDGLTSRDVDPWTGFLPAEGQAGTSELFMEGRVPEQRVGRNGGVCGEAILGETYESRFDNWMTANRDWIQRARRGPGTSGGPEGTRVSYFYNNGFNPFGRSWGPLLEGGGCGTPAPSPTCFPLPTPDASGLIPSFEVPVPSGSGPVALPCPTPSSQPSPSVEPSPSIEPTPEPTPPPPPTVAPTPPPTPTPPPGPPSREPGPPSGEPGPAGASADPAG